LFRFGFAGDYKESRPDCLALVPDGGLKGIGDRLENRLATASATIPPGILAIGVSLDIG